ncbi:MAG: DUF4129 domain-containing protein [Acidimicrobiales bacterium]
MDLPPSAHDPGAVRDLAERILAERRYHRPPKPILDRILQWLGEQLGKVLGSLVGSGAGTLIAWILVVGAVALVVYLIVRFGRVARFLPPPDRAARVMVELTRTPGEWRADAEALEAEGRWKEGLRCRHRALVAELVARGAIPDQAGRTAGEYVRDVAVSLPDAAPALAAATELFEAAWYGDVATGPVEAARFQILDAQVLAVRVGA